MKSHIFLLAFIGILAFSCQNKTKDDSLTGVVNNPLSADNPADPSAMPAITFETTEFDFGRIYEGEKVKCNFKFTNTGKSDLIITSAKASCGCTVPDYPKTPIKSGQGGSITVEFNSAGRKGQQNKAVTVTTNAQPPTVVLSVRAMIIEL
jgi:hypothetical protein